jgi:hypothetical protein
MKDCKLKLSIIIFSTLLVGVLIIVGCSKNMEDDVCKENEEMLVDQEGYEVYSGEELTVDFTVRVKDAKYRKPIENAEVKFAGEVGYTDNEGMVTFQDIETGDYKIEVIADGFLSFNFGEVIVTENTLPFGVDLLPTKDYEILYCFTSNAKQIWTPVPVYWDGYGTLDIEILEIKPIPTKLYTDEHGNQIAYWHNPNSTHTDYCLDFKIKVSEIRHDFSDYSFEYDQDSEIFITYTAPEEMTQSDDPRIISQAEEIVKDEVDPLEKVNKIASWVIRNIKPGEESYFPDALSILDNKVGSCGHFTNIFTALCRASGIPARNISVIHHPYEDDFQTGKLFEGLYFHVIAEFYLQDYGWVQVDPVRHTIGSIQEDIIIMSKGNSFILEEASFHKKHVWFHLPTKNCGEQESASIVEVKRIDNN